MTTIISGTTGITFPDGGVFTNGVGSAASSGYQKLPNGIIIQWGQLSVTTSGTFTCTFPIAFPTAFCSATATQNASSAGAESNIAITATSNSNMSVYHNSQGTVVYWIAIGH
jgi:hypothetical protein